MDNARSLLKWFFAKMFQYIFEASSLSFIVFFLLEFYKTGIVTNYFNINLLLPIILFSGIFYIILLSPSEGGKKKKSFFLPLVASIIIGIFFQSILPDSYTVYRILPWIAGLCAFFSIRLLYT